MEIKAIETHYKGYRFRSRLEARWATYLDAMGAKWYYEHEGYELPTGWYLPDFYLPEVKIHIEIKAPGFTCKHAARFRDIVGTIVVCNGYPGEKMTCYTFDFTDSSGGSSEWDECYFGHNENDEFCLYIDSGRRDRDFYVNGSFDPADRIVRGIPLDFSSHHRALELCKSARFER